MNQCTQLEAKNPVATRMVTSRQGVGSAGRKARVTPISAQPRASQKMIWNDQNVICRRRTREAIAACCSRDSIPAVCHGAALDQPPSRLAGATSLPTPVPSRWWGRYPMDIPEDCSRGFVPDGDRPAPHRIPAAAIQEDPSRAEPRHSQKHRSASRRPSRRFRSALPPPAGQPGVRSCVGSPPPLPPVGRPSDHHRSAAAPNAGRTGQPCGWRRWGGWQPKGGGRRYLPAAWDDTTGCSPPPGPRPVPPAPFHSRPAKARADRAPPPPQPGSAAGRPRRDPTRPEARALSAAGREGGTKTTRQD